ncbi:MAG: hypothetical protein K8R21_11820, partial [Leptospira sp.]|nr:hypothetical protein [Leptospira sp.]
MKMELEKNPLVQTVFEALDVIKSQKPFQIIFYGSRQRGDFSEISDYNFYLIASPQDQIKSSFIQATTKALDQLGVEIPVSLIAGDYDSFKMRMRFFEPTSIHICELGNTFYGTGDFETITDVWRNLKL